MTLDSNIVIAYLAGEDAIVEQLTQWRQSGRPAIAATALVSHTPLVTRNIKDFQRVKGLEIITV